MTLTHLSLFSGIGGLDIAAEWAGFETVGQCEWADYPTKVLEKHWPGIPRWRDIRTLTGEDFYEKTKIKHPTVVLTLAQAAAARCGRPKSCGGRAMGLRCPGPYIKGMSGRCWTFRTISCAFWISWRALDG